MASSEGEFGLRAALLLVLCTASLLLLSLGLMGRASAPWEAGGAARTPVLPRHGMNKGRIGATVQLARLRRCTMAATPPKGWIIPNSVRAASSGAEKVSDFAKKGFK